jgi:ElaB/YqjD/DUF883 family membrane-anchored ribosome-binding protein
MTTYTEETTSTSEGGPQRLAEAAGDIAEQATGVAEQHASSTMTQLGDTIEQVARAVRNSAEQLRDDQPQLAKLADTAADRAESAAQFLRQHEARDVLDEVQDFARRQPAVVVGAGLALGLLVGRGVKSAGPSAQRGSYGGRRYSDDDRGDYGYASASTGSGSKSPTDAATDLGDAGSAGWTGDADAER